MKTRFGQPVIKVKEPVEFIPMKIDPPDISFDRIKLDYSIMGIPVQKVNAILHTGTSEKITRLWFLKIRVKNCFKFLINKFYNRRNK